MNKKTLLTILLSAFFIGVAQPSDGSILIGRITHVEGQLFTYSEDEEDWVEIETNAPVGAEDGFYTDEGAKAELIFPNDTMLRMGEATEVEILSIEGEATKIYIRTGIVRAYSRGPDTVMKVETAMGYVEIPPQGIADFYVDDRSAEIVPVQQDILFHKIVGADAPEIHQLRAGSKSLIISVRYVATGTALADTSWNRWCLERDTILEEQAAIRSAHLPSSLQNYSYELEPYGEWQRMKYRDYYYWFWRPVRVSIGWTPFTTGWWSRWHGEYVWVPTEPWGWCTYHYGNWVNLNDAWWWTPYVHMGVSFPGISLVNLNIHFGPLFKPFWHPGRVAWISTTNHVGWIPLAPWETYYGRRKWGPRTEVVKYKDRPKSRNHTNHYAYQEHSMIVPQKEFRRVDHDKQHDYRKLTVTGGKKKTLLKNSKPTYGRHKMVGVKQNIPKGKDKIKATRHKTFTKPNTYGSSTPPVRDSRERALSKREKKTTPSQKETGDRIAKVSKRPPLPSSNLKSGKKEPPQVSTAPAPGNSLEKRRKQASSQPRQKKEITDRHTIPMEVSKRKELSNPEKKATPPRKETGDRIAKVSKHPPLTSSNSKSGGKEFPQVSTAPAPRKASKRPEYFTGQNSEQTRPKQRVIQSSARPPIQHMNKETVPTNSGPSTMSQPSENSRKWDSPQPRQSRVTTGHQKTPRQKRR